MQRGGQGQQPSRGRAGFHLMPVSDFPGPPRSLGLIDRKAVLRRPVVSLERGGWMARLPPCFV